MKINELTKRELESITYVDISYMILKEENNKFNTPTLFRKVCDILELSDEVFENKIGEYYTDLTLDKRFIIMKDATWELRENTKVETLLDEDDETEYLDEEEEVEEDLELTCEGLELEDDDAEDDDADLNIIDEEDLDL